MNLLSLHLGNYYTRSILVEHRRFRPEHHQSNTTCFFTWGSQISCIDSHGSSLSLSGWKTELDEGRGINDRVIMDRVVSRDIMPSPARSFISIPQLTLLGSGYEITATGYASMTLK